ncbi:MAG: ABC transporter permease [Propionibacteriaceae bacterium]|nr:ABC transporter permease [Propionibacteriaceae bacterium]
MRRRSNRLRGPAALLAPLGLGLVLLLGWFALTAPGQIPAYLLPGPGAVLDRLGEGLITRGNLWPYLRVTFGEAGLGCLVGVVVALPLAVVITHSRWAAAAVTPFLGATQAIPAIALAPLLVVWIGYGRSPVVALCALMVFFPILVSSVVGLRHLDPDILDAAAMDGAGFWARLGLIEFPLAGASIMAGLRNGFTLSVTGAVVGEMVMGGAGLGMLLTVQRDSNNMSGMIATIVVLAVLASTIYSLISLIERRAFVSESPRR